ncbi:MAG: hypothetical protein WC307_06950 [Candidatus Nanoarchaeia archaeon]|jgi:hypothetical protein
MRKQAVDLINELQLGLDHLSEVSTKKYSYTIIVTEHNSLGNNSTIRLTHEEIFKLQEQL